MSPAVKTGFGGALGGLIGALLLTFVFPSDHAHAVSSVWTDHLPMFILFPACGFVGAYISGRKHLR